MMMPNTKMVEIRDDSVVLHVGEITSSFPADTVVLALGAVSNEVLSKLAIARGNETVVVGDAKGARRL